MEGGGAAGREQDDPPCRRGAKGVPPGVADDLARIPVIQGRQAPRRMAAPRFCGMSG